MVHSDQGNQYTSKEFAEYCESIGIMQSMSKAGYPYDNAPMERYFNTLKNDLIYQHYYHTEEELYTAIEEFAYVHYTMYDRILIIITKRLLGHAMGLHRFIAKKLGRNVTKMLDHNIERQGNGD